jgi:hypothetical protein
LRSSDRFGEASTRTAAGGMVASECAVANVSFFAA